MLAFAPPSDQKLHRRHKAKPIATLHNSEQTELTYTPDPCKPVPMAPEAKSMSTCVGSGLMLSVGVYSLDKFV